MSPTIRGGADGVYGDAWKQQSTHRPSMSAPAGPPDAQHRGAVDDPWNAGDPWPLPVAALTVEPVSGLYFARHDEWLSA